MLETPLRTGSTGAIPLRQAAGIAAAAVVEIAARCAMRNNGRVRRSPSSGTRLRLNGVSTRTGAATSASIGKDFERVPASACLLACPSSEQAVANTDVSASCERLQVGRVHAQRGAAPVMDFILRGNLVPRMQLIRVAVCVHTQRGRSAGVDIEDAVAAIRTASPEPTVVGSGPGYITPETYFGRRCLPTPHAHQMQYITWANQRRLRRRPL